MPRRVPSSGFVALPSDVRICADSSSTAPSDVTIQPLQYLDGSGAKELAPIFVLKEANKPRMLVQVMRFSQPFGSWFIVPEPTSLVPTVSSNGNITFITKVDPLFLALALMHDLRTVGGKDVFQPLEALCMTEDGTNLANICEAEQFSLICDVKEAAHLHFYRLNDQKAIDWLIQKHSALRDHPQFTSETALEVLAQFLSKTWNKILRTALDAHTDSPANVAVDGQQHSEDLALQIMLDEAKATNRVKRSMYQTESAPVSKTRKTTPVKKKSQAPSAKMSKFWGSVKPS